MSRKKEQEEKERKKRGGGGARIKKVKKEGKTRKQTERRGCQREKKEGKMMLKNRGSKN